MAEKQRAHSRKATIRTIVGGIIIACLLFVLDSHFPTLTNLAELKTFDLQVHARGVRKPTGNVVIVAVDDKSIAQIGHWPWPRHQFAALVDALAKYKVAVIGFDMVLSEPDAADTEAAAFAAKLKAAGINAPLSTLVGPSNDEQLAQALKAQGDAIMGYAFQSHGDSDRRVAAGAGFVAKVVPPAPMSYSLVRQPPGGAHPIVPESPAYLPNIPVIQKASRSTAYFDIDTDEDAIIRSELMTVRFGGRYYVPLCLAVARMLRHKPMLALYLQPFGISRVTLGPTDIPVDELGRMLINYRGPEKTFPYYSASDVIGGIAPADALAGKAVLVGVTARGLGDRVATPFGAYFPGVEVHANAVDNILAGDFIHRSKMDAGWERIAAMVVALMVTLAVAFLPATWAFLGTAGIAAIYVGLAQYYLVTEGTLIGLVRPLAALAFTYTGLASYRYFTEGLEKRHLRHAFEHYLHPRVIESIVNDPDSLRLGGERRHLSILFSDIVGFTSRAEKSKPEELVALLNTYMTSMTDLIMEGGGVVDKLMGDGIMAFWGAPAHHPNGARAAIDCALKMLSELDRLRREDSRFVDLDIGIGVASGDVIVGNFGGQRRFDYSAIGDTVNFASRLEGLTRKFKTHLLVSETTLKEAGEAQYTARRLGMVRVKGKAQVVGIAEVVGRAGSPPADYFERFSHALTLLVDGSHAEGEAHLRELMRERPDDAVIHLYLDRITGGLALNGGEGALVLEFDSK